MRPQSTTRRVREAVPVDERRGRATEIGRNGLIEPFSCPYGSAIADLDEDATAFSHRRTRFEYLPGVKWTGPRAVGVEDAVTGQTRDVRHLGNSVTAPRFRAIKGRHVHDTDAGVLRAARPSPRAGRWLR